MLLELAQYSRQMTGGTGVGDRISTVVAGQTAGKVIAVATQGRGELCDVCVA